MELVPGGVSRGAETPGGLTKLDDDCLVFSHDFQLVVQVIAHFASPVSEICTGQKKRGWESCRSVGRDINIWVGCRKEGAPTNGNFFLDRGPSELHLHACDALHFQSFLNPILVDHALPSLHWDTETRARQWLIETAIDRLRSPMNHPTNDQNLTGPFTRGQPSSRLSLGRHRKKSCQSTMRWIVCSRMNRGSRLARRMWTGSSSTACTCPFDSRDANSLQAP
jgi:hypothetical protein